MQNTTGKLMERIVARKLAQDPEKINVLLPNERGYRAGKNTWENAARFAYDVYEGFQRKEQTLAVAVDLAGRCVQQSAIQTAEGTPCTIWHQLDAYKMARSSIPEKKGRHATWKLDLHAPATDNGTSTSPPLLSPVLYNVYTKGLADLNSNGLSRVLTLADDGFIYKTASDTHRAVTAAQEQLDKVSQWYQETESDINPSKAQGLWCALNNKAVRQAMPAVPFNGEVTERTNSLRYFGIHFDRMQT